MSVTSTNISYKPIRLSAKDRLSILKKRGLDIPFEFRISGSVTGDGSGGYVAFPYDFSTNLDKSLYYCISKIYTFDSAIGDQRLTAHSDRWENTYDANFADSDITIWAANGVYYQYDHTNKPNPIIYLGKPRNADADSGKITLFFQTNTDTYAYRSIILGFALTNPLPLASMGELFL